MKTRTYGVFLIGDSYLPGVIALKKSIDLVGSRFPLTAFCSECSSEAKESMKKEGILVVEVDALVPPTLIFEKNQRDGRPRWNSTFSKLGVLRMDQFEKIVLLDADMMILRNVDTLFDCPHMSAVVAGKGIHKEWVDLNSGLMVLTPSGSTYDKAIEIMQRMDKDALKSYIGFGDQDVFKLLYPDWKQNSILHLDETYNVFQDCVGPYEKKGLPLSKIGVLHFELSPKPWNYSLRDWLSVLKRTVASGSFAEFKMLKKYRGLLK